MDAEFWIDVSLQDEEMENKLFRAIAALQQAHNFTIQKLNQHFVKNKKLTAYADFRDEFARYIKKEKLWQFVQRYSLERIVEIAFPYYAKNIQLKNKGTELAEVPPDTINSIIIRSRKIWKRYLAEGKGLTTSYGMVYLDENWKKILREQAGNIELDLFPYLWHSITLRVIATDIKENQWQVHFNFHAPSTSYGIQAAIELEKDFAGE